MIEISPTIYNGTLLEGLPCKLKYYEKYPKHLYHVQSDGRIRLANCANWHNLYDENRRLTQTRIWNLFTHDLSHAILYYMRGETDKLFLDDFGLNWDKVYYIDKEKSSDRYFKAKKEREDEYKVTVVHEFIFSSLVKQSPLSFRDQTLQTFNSAYDIWHTRKVFDGNKIRKEVSAQKKEEVDRAVREIYYGIGVAAVRDAARELVHFYKDHV